MKKTKDDGTALEIENIDFEDAGIYECTGDNGIGRITYNFTVKVEGNVYCFRYMC